MNPNQSITAESLTEAVQAGAIDQKTFDSEIAKIHTPGASDPVKAGKNDIAPDPLAAKFAVEIDRFEAEGKMTPEQAAQARLESGVEKGPVKSKELQEHECLYGAPATNPTEFIFPPMSNATEKEALQSRDFFTKALLAGEFTAPTGNALIEAARRADRMIEHLSPSERSVRETDSMTALEKRYGKSFPAMMERGRVFMAHMEKASPGIGKYFKNSGILDINPMALSIFLGASEQWHGRQKAKGER